MIFVVGTVNFVVVGGFDRDFRCCWVIGGYLYWIVLPWGVVRCSHSLNR